MKRCPKCGETKDRTGFNPNRARRDGLASWCRECMKANYRANRRKRLAQMRAYDAAHADSHRARSKAWRDAHPREFKEQLRQWQEKNRDYYFARQADGARRRRARKRENGIVPYRREDIYERDGWTCWLCGKLVGQGKGEASVDHVIPLCEGGPDSPDNVKLAHTICNVRRGRTLLRDTDEVLDERAGAGVHGDLTAVRG